MKNKLIDNYDKVFIKTFKIKKEKLKKLKYESVPQWDSIGHMSMIGMLEETFNITLEMDDIIDFSSYKKGIEILRGYDIVF